MRPKQKAAFSPPGALSKKMDLKGKKVLVVGLARTGVATVQFLAKRGARVKASDAKTAAELAPFLGPVQGLPLEWELGGHTVPFFSDVDLIVMSPGVPLNLPPVAKAQARGIPVISEVELAFRFLRRPLIAITGTNGKTTTTTLIGEMLKGSGKKVFLGGNIGNPLISYVEGPQDDDWVVAEISSFQLEGVSEFRPKISVLLNLTEDHLDRYETFGEYIAAKERIFAKQKKEDYALLNADDPLTFALARRLEPQVFLFSARRAVSFGSHLTPEGIIFQGPNGNGTREKFELGRLKIKGAHNVENLMAAIAVCKMCRCPRETLQRVMEEFPGIEHRLEWVRQLDGVSYFNDSKGTNVGSVVKSLQSFEEPVILIAGGKDKGGDYGPLKNLIAERVKAMALIGEAQDRMFSALGSLTETAKIGSLEEAVRWARSKARPGEIVLLSPACSSYDMFANYQERGKRFKEIVLTLEQAGMAETQKSA
ncbi:MAG: murD [Deltaproteobacteria bacterium]|nr:murD [Deltaproteobacteria bacterium]